MNRNVDTVVAIETHISLVVKLVDQENEELST